MEDSSLSTSGGDTGPLLDSSDSELDKILSSEGTGTEEGSALSSERAFETSESEESSSESSSLVRESPSSSFFDRVKNFEYLKVFQTIPAWITMFVCGVSLVVAGATLDTLDKVVEGNVSWSIFYTRATGVCLGSLIGGIITDEVISRLQKKFKSKILLDRNDKSPPSFMDKVTSSFLRSIFSIHTYILFFILLFIIFYLLVPTYPYYIPLNIFMFGIGFCFGAGQCGAMVCIGWIWKEKTTIPMQVFQLHLGVGVALFPYVMTHILKMYEDPSDQLYYEYVIGAIFSASPILFLILFPSPLSPLLSKEEEERKIDEVVQLEERQQMQQFKKIEEEEEDMEQEQQQVGEVPKLTANLYWIFIGVFYVFIAATEVVLPSLYIKYMTNEVDPISNNKEATQTFTDHYILYLLSKVAVIFLVAVIPGVYILGVDIAVSIVCGIVLIFFPRTKIVIRIAFVVAGWFVSQLFGLGFSVPVRYGVTMSGVGGASTVIGSAIGVGLTSSVATIMDKSENDLSLFLSYLFFGIGSMVIWLILLCVGSMIKIKYVLKKKVDVRLIWKYL